MFQDITLEKLQKKLKQGEHTIIDVRSPKEFLENTIPGSINIPVFSDEERAMVGTIYKQIGQREAEKKGLEIFSRKLPAFIEEFRQIKTEMTVFCWRGGMRSKTAATVLDLMGIHVNRLSGGIRSYRQWVVSMLEDTTFIPKLFVLDGFTGTGKTWLLQALKNKGFPCIDLERLAGHRGSIFGQIGLQPSKQKQFDTLLVEEIQQYQQEKFVFIEGESKRIGNVRIPDSLFQKKENGYHIFVDLPMNIRIKNILADYQPWKKPEEFLEAFQIIKKRIHIPIANEISTALTEGDFHTAVHLLLVHYYDPRYSHANQHYQKDKKWTITGENMEEVLQELILFAQNHY